MEAYILIATGSALGGMGRFWLSTFAAGLGDGRFPWGTIVINVIGSFVIGFFSTLSGPDGRLLIRPEHRQFITVGLCGGFTTFSSFSLQTLDLMRSGEWISAGLNVSLSVILCLISVGLGHAAASALNQLRGA